MPTVKPNVLHSHHSQQLSREAHAINTKNNRPTKLTLTSAGEMTDLSIQDMSHWLAVGVSN